MATAVYYKNNSVKAFWLRESSSLLDRHFLCRNGSASLTNWEGSTTPNYQLMLISTVKVTVRLIWNFQSQSGCKLMEWTEITYLNVLSSLLLKNYILSVLSFKFSITWIGYIWCCHSDAGLLLWCFMVCVCLCVWWLIEGCHPCCLNIYSWFIIYLLMMDKLTATA